VRRGHHPEESGGDPDDAIRHRIVALNCLDRRATRAYEVADAQIQRRRRSGRRGSVPRVSQPAECRTPRTGAHAQQRFTDGPLPGRAAVLLQRIFAKIRRLRPPGGLAGNLPVAPTSLLNMLRCRSMTRAMIALLMLMV
jgi:hypothetical protein